ncbi:MAG: hypothetical protein Q8P19_00050 [bacterium]|nr:hypothetical protein [bacterium]
MLEKKFDKPGFLNPQIEIDDAWLPGSSTVKTLLKKEISQQSIESGKEVRTDHFYIKQVGDAVSEDASQLPLYLPEYYGASYILSVYYAQKRLSEGGKAPSIDELVAFFDGKENKLELKEGETAKSKIEKALDMLQPETVLRYHKQLYERHRDWYNKEIPDFVIDKLFVLGAGADGTKHGYVIKEHVPAPDERGEGHSDVTLQEILQEIRKISWSEDLRAAASQLADEIEKHFSPEQYATLADEMRKFAAITRNVIESEGLVIDPGGDRDDRAPNVRISSGGHLRMIDTDRVYPAKRGDGRYDTPAQQVFLMLKALESVATRLSDNKRA